MTSAAESGTGSFRDRLVEGLAQSIIERGFGETKVADIVANARTSRRTFYAEFANKEECYVALLADNDRALRELIVEYVDTTAPWEEQIRQAVLAYVEGTRRSPAVTVSWIRELPGLGNLGRQVQRDALEQLTDLLMGLSASEPFVAAGTVPLTRPLAYLILGGIRELTAILVEDERDIGELTDVVVDAAVAMLRAR